MGLFRYHHLKCGMTNIDYAQAATHLCPATGVWMGFSMEPVSLEKGVAELNKLLAKERAEAGLDPESGPQFQVQGGDVVFAKLGRPLKRIHRLIHPTHSGRV